MTRPRGAGAVMAGRVEPWDGLDCFPTPPWATRALTRHVLPTLGIDLADATVWEPACGLGHMAEPLREAARLVHGSDVFDYGHGYEVSDFLRADPLGRPDWIITNPPFNQAGAFLERACDKATVGVAFLCRLALIEGAKRYALFGGRCPNLVAVFSERVPMVKGRWDPDASTATAYAWFVWRRALGRWRYATPEVEPRHHIPLMLIPPGCRRILSLPSDRVLARRVAPGCEVPAPLMET